jgi:hypothetical protein
MSVLRVLACYTQSINFGSAGLQVEVLAANALSKIRPALYEAQRGRSPARFAQIAGGMSGHPIDTHFRIFTLASTPLQPIVVSQVHMSCTHEPQPSFPLSHVSNGVVNDAALSAACDCPDRRFEWLIRPSLQTAVGPCFLAQDGAPYRPRLLSSGNPSHPRRQSSAAGAGVAGLSPSQRSPIAPLAEAAVAVANIVVQTAGQKRKSYSASVPQTGACEESVCDGSAAKLPRAESCGSAAGVIQSRQPDVPTASRADSDAIVLPAFVLVSPCFSDKLLRDIIEVQNPGGCVQVFSNAYTC